MTIQIEVETLAQLEHALRAGARSILLDNFDEAALKAAVAINREAGAPALLEAAGGVDADSVARVAGTGVDRISVGQLTKHIRAIDYSLRLEA